MRAIVLEAPGRLAWAARAAPEPKPGEALVRVRRVGICGTDLNAYRGRQPFFTYPRVLGHELAVEVVAVGASPSGLAPGQTCAVVPYLNCGACVACRRGRPNCCVTLAVLGVHRDGGLTEYLCVPEENLIPAGGLSLEQLALVENQSIGWHAVRRAAPEAGERALVVGAGPIGLGVVQALQLRGAQVLVADVNPQRLRFCRDVLGVRCTVDAREDLAESLRRLGGGELPTLVFDATGNPASMAAAFGWVAHGGRLVFVGLAQAQIAFADPEFHRRELTLLASRNATRADFEGVMAAMRAGAMQSSALVTHRVQFAEAIEAFATWLDPASGVIKALVDLDEGA